MANGANGKRTNGLGVQILISVLLVIVTCLTTLVVSNASGERRYVLRCEWEVLAKRMDRMDLRDQRIEDKIDKIIQMHTGK